MCHIDLVMVGHRRKQRLWCLCVLVWFSILLLGTGEPCLGEQLSDEVVLTARSTDNQSPNIATSSDGRHVFVVWDGIIGDSRRIFCRERIDGIWLPEVVVDDEPAAQNNSPSIDVDAQGNPHIAWLAQHRDRFGVSCAFRTAGIWSHRDAIDSGKDTEPDAQSVQIRVDTEDIPWIIWQSGLASRYSVHCAHLDPRSGGFLLDSLTPESRNYNLNPQFLFTPQPLAVWYAAENADFRLTAKAYMTTGEWTSVVLQDLQKMPGNRFPYLLRHPAGIVIGLWYDQESASSLERIYVGTQNGKTQGEGQIIDTEPAAVNKMVSGAISGGEVVAVWCRVTEGSGSQVFLSHGMSLPFSGDIRLSDGRKKSYTQPRVASVPGGAAVVWQSTAADGREDGRIFFRSITF